MNVDTARFFSEPERFLVSDNPYVREVIADGFCIVRDAVREDLIDAFLDRYRGFKLETVRPHDNKLTNGIDVVNGCYRRMVNMHLVVPELALLFYENTALLTLDELFGEPATLYTSLYFEVGSCQELHRDTPYFWTNPGYSYFGVWLALESTDKGNGALEVVKGSHLIEDSLEMRARIGKLDLDAQGFPNPHSSTIWTAYQAEISDACARKSLTKTPIYVNKGDVIIWHPQLMHGGSAIQDTSRTRNSLVMHVTPKFQLVYGMDKYFDPSCALPSIDPFIKYQQSQNGRLARDNGVWAISQKVFLPTAMALL